MLLFTTVLIAWQWRRNIKWPKDTEGGGGTR